MQAPIFSFTPRKHRIYPFLNFIVIALVFIYLFIRTFSTGPLLDETFSFHYFSYLGFYKGHRVVYDANNHFLNSFLGNTLYPFFKSNIQLYRIPNLLASILYFTGILKIGSYLKTERTAFLLLLFSCFRFRFCFLSCSKTS